MKPGMHVFWGIVIGGVLAISDIPMFFVPICVVWLAWVLEKASRGPASQRWRHACKVLVIQGTAIAFVLGLAALAPVKTKAAILSRSVVLPKTDMTLQELQEVTNAGQFRLPVKFSVTIRETQRQSIVSWPSKELSLDEFVAAIEKQTPLRHRFGSCMGWTVLWGRDCVFGLSMRDTNQDALP
jgi:hypothetical protein